MRTNIKVVDVKICYIKVSNRNVTTTAIVVSRLHRASVPFISRLMHSNINVVDVKICFI
jgi:hypothetical protein